MVESGTEYRPTDSSPQLIAKEMNHELDTKIADNFCRNRSERMRDDASGPKRHGDAGSGQAF